MRIPDYHMHTQYSPDSRMTQQDAVEAAIRMGVTDLCYTEHMDLGHPNPAFDRVPRFAEMQAGIDALQAQYPDVKIHMGIEVGYREETAKASREALEGVSFDYMLISTHCVDGLDTYQLVSTGEQDREPMYRRYLETVYASVTDETLRDYYDCVAHIGYPAKRKLFRESSMTYDLFPALFDDILKAIIRQGKGMEINTSSWKGLGHVLPHPSLLMRYRELGGRIVTIGTDSHDKENVGTYCRESIELLKACGFREYAIYEKREPVFVEIK